MRRSSRDRLAALAVLVAAAGVAAASARPWVGSWNDGSRLATVESLVDRHTFAIDDSIFVRRAGDGADAAVPVLTQDKLFIDGRYYSDKPPVPALLLAVPYQLWRWVGGARAAQQPDRFIYWMTLASSGLAYVVAVLSVYLTGQVLRVPLAPRLMLTASLALATVALAYTRHVNGHILLLGVAALLFLQLARHARPGAVGDRYLVLLGTVAGYGYTADLLAGPLLFAAVAALVAHRRRAWRAVALFGMAAFPWLALQHTLSWAIGGTLLPLNAVPAYLEWPGSPFGRANMTGVWQHDGLGALITYALALLFGRRGFLVHDLPLLLAAASLPALWRLRPHEAPELVCALTWCIATWLGYAIASHNYSGECVSIRWFVPFLASGYFVLVVLLRERPRLFAYLVILSVWGAVLAARAWWIGPWVSRIGPWFWPVQAAALASCAAWYGSRRRVDRDLVAAAAFDAAARDRAAPHGWRPSV